MNWTTDQLAQKGYQLNQDGSYSIKPKHWSEQKKQKLAPNVKRGSWKAQWAEIGGKRFYARSSWEITHANWLQSIKEKQIIKDWNHEPKTFWFTGIKRGAMSYLPDFELTLIDNTTEYHEVKGWMDSRSKTKIKRFRKQYPQFQLKVFGKSNDPLIQFKIPQSYLITDYSQLQQTTDNQ